MKKSNLHWGSRRTLLALVLGIGLPLFVFTVGTVVANRPSPTVNSPAPALSAQAGPYTIALSIAPTSPQAIQTTHLTFRLTDNSTKQTITDAGVEIRGMMESMDMAMGPLYANPQNDGAYAADIKFSMPGVWRLQVSVTRPNASAVATQFEVTAAQPQS